MKLKQIIAAYKALGEAKATSLEMKEIIKIVKARKAMRPYAEEFESFLKDVQEKFKPENWDEVQVKVQQWQQEGDKTTLPQSERTSINKVLMDYQKKIDSAVREELEREIEIIVEALTEDSATKILVENGWEMRKLEEIEIIL